MTKAIILLGGIHLDQFLCTQCETQFIFHLILTFWFSHLYWTVDNTETQRELL